MSLYEVTIEYGDLAGDGWAITRVVEMAPEKAIQLHQSILETLEDSEYAGKFFHQIKPAQTTCLTYGLMSGEFFAEWDKLVRIEAQGGKV